MYDPSETTIRMASLHSAGIAVPSGGSSGDSSSDAGSAVAVGKSSAKSTKQYISALSTSTVRSLSLGHASEMPRRRAVFVKVRSLNQDWRTGTLLIHLNLDIHKLLNVIRPLFEEVHWRQILFAKFCFRDNFEGIKPNGCQEFELIVFTV